MQRCAFFALMTLALAGCATPAEPTESAPQPIIGGYASTSSDDAVVLLYRTSGGGSICSATMLASNLLATARHCIVATPVQDGFICQPDGTLQYPGAGMVGDAAVANTIAVFPGATVPNDGTFPVGTPAAHGSMIFTTTSPSICRDDLAFVVLDTDLSLPAVPLRLDQRVMPYDTVSTIGYGWTETTTPSMLYSASRMRRDDVQVEFTGILPSTFTLGRSSCKGDSGGPALDTKTGALVGVFSIGIPGNTVSACSSEEAVNYYVQIADYHDLLVQAFAGAGHPLMEVPDGGTDGGDADGGSSTSTAESSSTSSTSAGTGGTGGAGGAGGSGGGGSVPMHTTGSCAVGQRPLASSGVPWLTGLALFGWALSRRRKLAR